MMFFRSLLSLLAAWSWLIGASQAMSQRDLADPEPSDAVSQLIDLCSTTFTVADTNVDNVPSEEEFRQHISLIAAEVCPSVTRINTYTDDQAFRDNFSAMYCLACVGALDPGDPDAVFGNEEICGCNDPSLAEGQSLLLQTVVEVTSYCSVANEFAMMQCYQPTPECYEPCREEETSCYDSCYARDPQGENSAFLTCFSECSPAFLSCVEGCGTAFEMESSAASSRFLLLPMISLLFLPVVLEIFRCA